MRGERDHLPESHNHPVLPSQPGHPEHRADEVDRLVTQWAIVAPELDSAPLEVFSRISRLAWHLETLRRNTFAQHGLDAWEFDVLSALRRAGDPHELTPKALAHDTLVTSGTMTVRVEKLQARGLVTRSRAPEDGRSVVIRLSAEGAALVNGAIASLVASERELLAGLTPDAVTGLATSLRTLLHSVERDDSRGGEGSARAV